MNPSRVSSRPLLSCLIIAIIFFGVGGCQKTSNVRKFAPADLMEWDLMGVGSREVDEELNALVLIEGKDSKGLVIVSPENLGADLTVRFKVKPLQYEGICVIILSASTINGGPIVLPTDYDGDFGIWRSDTTDIQSYIFAFHTGYHQPNAFITKNPGFVDLARESDIATDQVWYDIELGKRDAQVWLKVDNQLVLSATDQGDLLQGGKLGLRLRGPGDGSFSCLFKDITITEYDLN